MELAISQKLGPRIISMGGTTHILGCPPAKGCGTVYELSPTVGGLWQKTASAFQLVPGDNGWIDNLLYSLGGGGTRFGANPLGGVERRSAELRMQRGHQARGHCTLTQTN
ncbi:MAG: hypothetical protein WBE52_21205 [Terriglobales bacterium]